MPLLAHHRAQGDQIEEAIDAYLTAAEHAASIYANREAILYLETALWVEEFVDTDIAAVEKLAAELAG